MPGIEYVEFPQVFQSTFETIGERRAVFLAKQRSDLSSRKLNDATVHVAVQDIPSDGAQGLNAYQGETSFLGRGWVIEKRAWQMPRDGTPVLDANVLDSDDASSWV